MATGAQSFDAPTGEDDYELVSGSGWVTFAGVMLGVAGTWNLIDGILAIANSKVYGHNDRTYIFSDLRTWGWIVLVLGIAQLFAAFAVMAGSEVARWFGIAVAAVNSIGQLSFVPVYPFWALMMFSVDVIIIYGLAVYGGKRLRVD